ncbi:RNA polymerase sigma-70 factor, ECF subfamily [bacterium A37T11]|nr:RNA polymerase sigma-70 factor, ECF subfamily [bacterium A37T11]
MERIDEPKESMGDSEGLFRIYYPRLCDFAKRYLMDSDEAEDVVQDAFVAFLEQETYLDIQPNAVKAFLYTTVKNACLNKLRHEKVKTRYHQHNLPPLTDNTYALNSMIHAEVIGEIHKAIQSLPSGCALVVKMGYLEGLKNPQIAEELGISVNTVKSQKQRGLQLLKELLKPATFMLLLSLFS